MVPPIKKISIKSMKLIYNTINGYFKAITFTTYYFPFYYYIITLMFF